MDYEKGDIIKFKDQHQYEVLSLHKNGYTVAESGEDFGMNHVYFFRKEFLKEAERRNLIIPDRTREKEADED